MIKQFGVKEAPAIPFPPFKTFQTPIPSIEKLTGLAFTGSVGGKPIVLSDFDPLTQPARRDRQARSAEGQGTDQLIELTHLDDLVLTR